MLNADDLYNLVDKEMEVLSKLYEYEPHLFQEISQKIFDVFYALIKTHRELIPEKMNLKNTSSLYINGVLIRTLNHYRGAIWALSTKNIHVLADALRGLLETLATVNYYNNEKNNYEDVLISGKIEEFFPKEAINVMTTLKHLEKEIPGIQHYYSILCERVHPNALSFLESFDNVNENMTGEFIVSSELQNQIINTEFIQDILPTIRTSVDKILTQIITFNRKIIEKEKPKI